MIQNGRMARRLSEQTMLTREEAQAKRNTAVKRDGKIWEIIGEEEKVVASSIEDHPEEKRKEI